MALFNREKFEELAGENGRYCFFAACSTFLTGGQLFIEPSETLPETNSPASALLRY